MPAAPRRREAGLGRGNPGPVRVAGGGPGGGEENKDVCVVDRAWGALGGNEASGRMGGWVYKRKGRGVLGIVGEVGAKWREHGGTLRCDSWEQHRGALSEKWGIGLVGLWGSTQGGPEGI